MPARNLPLVNGEYYHVINRGVARMPIFSTGRDYQRFINAFTYYLNIQPQTRFSFNKRQILQAEERIVDIISFCLMPNHFHFLLKQNVDDGIMNFIRKTSNSYAKYFNIKRKRKGPLFEGKFKAVRIETNEQLLHLSRYIHLNPLVGYVVKDIKMHKWSSYFEFINNTNSGICSKEIILDQFKTAKNYKKFVLNHEDYGKQLEKIKHKLLEEIT